MTLDRFKTAQSDPTSGFQTALAELRAGRKTSHWIWYIFPQLADLGRSETARFYGIRDIDEARAYLADPLLRANLLAVTAAVHDQLAAGTPIEDLMGGPTDNLKLVSSLTLFHAVAVGSDANDPDLARFIRESESILSRAEAAGYARCEHTLNACAA